jgi:hypothetical protein
MEVSGKLHDLAVYPYGSISQYPLDIKLCGNQIRYVRCGDKNMFGPGGNRIHTS